MDNAPSDEKSMKIATKLYSVVALMAVLVITVSGIGFYAAKVGNNGLDTVYNDRIVPLEHLKKISDMYAINIVDTAHKARDGSISWGEARTNVAFAQNIIAIKWREFLSTSLEHEEKTLVAETEPLMKRADAMVVKLNAILGAESKEELARFAAVDLYPAIDPLTGKISELVALQLVKANQEYQKSEFYYHQGNRLAIVLFVVGLLISVGISVAIIRRLLCSLGGEPSYVRDIALQIAAGDLSSSVNDQYSQKGSVLWSMKIMVEKLRDLIADKDEKNIRLESLKNELDGRVVELEAALTQVKQLEGIIPICMYCKKIRDDQNTWNQLEQYITEHSGAMFSHGICPNCAEEQMALIKKEITLR